jgi:hypothetical protein
MNKNILSWKINILTNKFRMFAVLIILSTVSFVSAQAQSNVSRLSASNLKLVKTVKINSQTQQAIKDVAPNAIYSNVTNYLGFYQNEGAAVQGTNTITTLVADSLSLSGTPPFSIGSFSFSVGNGNTVDVSASPLIRFYATDGLNGGPGTVIAGYDFDPISFTAESINIFTGNVAPFMITSKAIWAGITFDNNFGATGATITQLNLLGQGIFDPVDKGSSEDGFFQTDLAGDFGSGNPAGAVYDFGGSPVANFGWEIVSSIPLPVTFNDFNVKVNGQSNVLTWKTSQETNLNYFEIERSDNGTDFSKIGKVKAAGNSNSTIEYRYNDENPSGGINYYRLKIVDIGNTARLSEIKSVRNSFSNFTIYPNPASSQLITEITAIKEDNAELSISDLQGRKVYSAQIKILQGINKIPIDVSKYSQGTYYLRFKLGNINYTGKFSKL